MNDLEIQGRLTITLAATILFAGGISKDTAVREAVSIFDKVCEVEKAREDAANKER